MLANWTGTKIAYDIGLHMTVIATIGSSPTQTSPSTTLTDYAATNESPTANPDSATTDEDSFRTIDVLANDTDPEGDPLTVSSVDVTGTQGHVINHGTDVVYEPGSAFQSLAQGQSGSDSFTYTANDGHTDSNFAKVSLTITGVNDAPGGIALSNATVDENQPAGATVGSFATMDVDLGDTHTYTLVSGTGDADNASFQITGGTLKTMAAFDFETKAIYSIRAETRDSAGATYSRSFTISVNDVNEAPADITLSNATVAENRAAGEPVGTLAAVDPDTGQSHTFTLVTGAGDNALFQIPIGGDTLQTADVFDYEAKSSYTVHVRATDAGGLSVDKKFTVAVTDVNEAPDVVPATFSIPENSANGTAVGTVTYSDPETGQSHLFDITAGNVRRRVRDRSHHRRAHCAE